MRYCSQYFVANESSIPPQEKGERLYGASNGRGPKRLDKVTFDQLPKNPLIMIAPSEDVEDREEEDEDDMAVDKIENIVDTLQEYVDGVQKDGKKNNKDDF